MKKIKRLKVSIEVENIDGKIVRDGFILPNDIFNKREDVRKLYRESFEALYDGVSEELEDEQT